MNKFSIIILSIFSLFCSGFSMAAVELRAYIADMQSTRDALEKKEASFKGEYAFTDYIYQQNDVPVDLNKEFIRLRAYSQTQWLQKNFVIVHKCKETPGCSGAILWREECDTLVQAQQKLNDHVFRFSFYRHGYEYSLDGMKIFVEDIQGLQPTIEVIATTKNDIDMLFKAIPGTVIVTDSVPQLIENEHYK